MIEPVEAEMAFPPIFNEKQERVLRDEEIEEPEAIQRVATHHTQRSNSDATFVPTSANTDLEKGKDGKIIVSFEPGSGESPREWGKGMKWFATLSCSLLCLTVALGSSMPTGDLKGQAATLHASNEAIFLSISLFVLGFGIGPLIFAPCE